MQSVMSQRLPVSTEPVGQRLVKRFFHQVAKHFSLLILALLFQSVCDAAGHSLTPSGNALLILFYGLHLGINKVSLSQIESAIFLRGT